MDEASDYYSNSESDSFTSELTFHEQDAISNKIIKPKKKISELKDVFTLKEARLNKEQKTSKMTMNKVKKGSSSRSKVQIVEDESSDDKAFKVKMNKVKKGPLNRNKMQIKGPLKRSRLEENDTKFSSDDPEQESMRLIVAERLYHLCSTTEYHDMPLVEINKYIDKFRRKNPSFLATVSDWAEHEMICRHINYKRSTLNLSEIQNITIAANNRIKACKLNGNSKKAKMKKQADHNNEINSATDINSEMPEIYDTTTTAKNSDRSRTCKLNDNNRSKKDKQVDHNETNSAIDVNSEMSKIQSNNNSRSKKGKQVDHSKINPAIDVDSKMSEIQDTTTSNSSSKKGNQVDHNEINPAIDIDRKQVHYNEVIDVDSEMSEIQDTTTSNANSKTNLNNNRRSKKGKRVDHNKAIDVNSEMSENQDTTTSANNSDRTKFHKPNDYSNKSKKDPLLASSRTNIEGLKKLDKHPRSKV
ncbi:88_t:CDS:2 [Cetraspora pellucida]|uniref:88_t:CDS:1 n=1 Tax=Cetraspora pellucida TaxID=1433469 RepID=A0A9N9BEG9_9GLOM|nr:88_t:CDS:2 [Cetraspora pellucida]